MKYVGPPGVKNYTYFSLVDKRLASYHQSLLARGPRVRINLENIFNKLSMALSWLVLSALSDLEKHPDIPAFITQDHLWPKIVLESQNSVSLGIEFRTMMSNSIKKVCIELMWKCLIVILSQWWPGILYYGMFSEMIPIWQYWQYIDIYTLVPSPLYSPPSFHHQSKHKDFRNCIWIASINFLDYRG